MSRPPRSTEVIAHRGASAAATEHTDLAFELAIAQGAEAVEIDVRATADGELLVVHDTTLARTLGDARRVDSLERSDLQALPPPLRPLTLDDVLARYGHRTRVLIELKDPHPRWERLVVDAVRRRRLADRVELLSFDLRALARLATGAEELALCSLHFGRPSARTLAAVARYGVAVGVPHRSIDTRLMSVARDHGLLVRAWTVNEPAAIQRLVVLGVDGVITDVPDVAVAAGSAPVPAAA